jgi:AraC-like DNA-binding protein
MDVLVDTETVAPADRFEFWADAASAVLHPLGVRHLAAAPFRGRMRRWELGPLELFRIEGDASAIARTHATIAAHDPEELQVAVLRRGCFLVRQGDRVARIEAGDAASYETSHPYDVAADRGFDLLLFSAPRSVFGPRAASICRRTAVARPGRRGLGAIAVPFLMGVAGGLADGTIPAGDGDMADATLDVIRALHADETAPAAASGAELLARIKAHMHARLPDPDLSPARIAAAHFISVRLLHRLFAQEGTTVGRWLRDQRLERCRRDLADPALASLSVAEIAAAWGLRSPAHFSRVFRAAYGCAPSKVRRTGRQPDGASASTWRRSS